MDRIEINLNESLFTEAKYDKYKNDFIHSAHFKKATDPYDYNPDPNQRGIAENVLKIQAFLVLRLYEATILHLFDSTNPDNMISELNAKPIHLVEGKPYTCPVTGKQFGVEEPVYGIRRKDWLEMRGLANYDAPAEQQSLVDEMTRAGLGYNNPSGDPSTTNCIFPGGNLEKFINGELTYADNAQELYDVETVDPITHKKVKVREPNEKGKLKKVTALRQYMFNDKTLKDEIGRVKNVQLLKNACAPKTTLPGMSRFNFLPSVVEIDTKQPIIPQLKKAAEEAKKKEKERETSMNINPVDDSDRIEAVPLDLNQFKRKKKKLVQPTTESLTEAAVYSKTNSINRIKEEYCAENGYDPNMQLGPDQYYDLGFRYLCCRHNIPVKEYKNAIFGEF